MSLLTLLSTTRRLFWASVSLEDDVEALELLFRRVEVDPSSSLLLSAPLTLTRIPSKTWP